MAFRKTSRRIAAAQRAATRFDYWFQLMTDKGPGAELTAKEQARGDHLLAKW